MVTRNGQPAPGVTVELRQAGGGADKIIATAQTDNNGAYRFSNPPASPANTVYYIRYSGGASNSLAFWATLGQTYTAGATLTFATFDIADVQLGSPAAGSNVTLPVTLTWTSRNGNDTYSVRILSNGNQVLDSNDLGKATSYVIPAGVLGNGSYSAVVHIKQADGYGDSGARFSFSIGVPAAASASPVSGATMTATPVPPPPPPPPPPPSPPPTSVILSTQVPAPPANDVRLSKTVDHDEVSPGETARFTISIWNAGSGAATNARLTDEVPAGALVDLGHSSASAGSIDLRGQTFSANLGTIQPGARITVTIITSVIGQPNTSFANQARLVYDQTPAGITSDKVTVTVSAAGTPQAKRTATAIANTAGGSPTPKPKATATRTPSAGGGTTNTIPKTGGEFPIIGFLLGLAMLVPRQLRLRNQAACRDA
jgi:uncharacterized repeat protein (TIGR01451 family)